MAVSCCFRNTNKKGTYYTMEEKSWKRTSKCYKKNKKNKNKSRKIKIKKSEQSNDDSELVHETETEIYYCQKGVYNLQRAGKEVHLTADGWHEIRNTKREVQSSKDIIYDNPHSLEMPPQTSTPKVNQLIKIIDPLEANLHTDLNPSIILTSREPKEISLQNIKRKLSKDFKINSLETLEEENNLFEEDQSASPSGKSRTPVSMQFDPSDYYNDSEVSFTKFLF